MVANKLNNFVVMGATEIITFKSTTHVQNTSVKQSKDFDK